MNTQTTIERLKSLRLRAMSDLYHRSMNEKNFPKYTIDEFLALMVDAQWEDRHNRKIATLIKNAQFNESTSPHDIDYTSMRNLDKSTFERLLSLNFIKQTENIIITGSTGVGKSYVAQAIGIQACQSTIKTIYFNWMNFSEKIKIAKLDGTYLKLLQKIENTDLLILDDFGLQPFDNYTRQALMDIIESKYNKGSVIICTQIPVEQWHELIGEGTIADAILDRLVYASHRIELKGESLRKKRQLLG
jgi:DNA replication protein DnaC